MITALAGEFLAGRRVSDHPVREIGQGECVGQETQSAAAPHAGQSERLRQSGGSLILPEEPSGRNQRVAAAPVVLTSISREQNFVGTVADIDQIGDACGLDRLILEAEPAPLADILRQRFVFDQFDGCRGKHLRQTVRITSVTNSGSGSAPAYASSACSLAVASANQ